MGRELSVDRIDFMKDGSVVIRECEDYFVCGRNDFTNAMANLFNNKEVTALIVDYPKKVGRVHVNVDGDAWPTKEFDLDFASINRETIGEIFNEHIKKDDDELAREHDMLEDARAARKNTSTVEDFNNFSDLIDSLQEHIDRYCEHAKLYASYVNRLNLCFDENTTEATYVLLTLSE